MALRTSPEEYADKLIRRTQGASQDYTAGIRRVTQAPGAAAAAKEAKYLTGVQEAVASGLWKQRVGSVSLADWQQASVEKGAARLGAGVAASRAKIVSTATQLLAAVDSARSKVRSMPDTTLQDRINRSVAYQTEMAKFRKR